MPIKIAPSAGPKKGGVAKAPKAKKSGTVTVGVKGIKAKKA